MMKNSFLILIFAIIILLNNVISNVSADVNLLQNGDFEGLGDGIIPQGWGPWAGNTSGMSVIEGFQGKSARIKTDRFACVYFTQGIDVKKVRGKALILSAMVKVEEIGEFKYGYSGSRLMIITEDGTAMEGGFRENVDWTELTLDSWIVPANTDTITVCIGTHTAKGIFSFDNVTLTAVSLEESERIKAEKAKGATVTITKEISEGVATGILKGKEVLLVNGVAYNRQEHKKDKPLSNISAQDKQKGYITFVRTNQNIFPDSIPQHDEIVNELSIAATPGEYEPVTFACYPLRDMGRVKVEVADFVTSQRDKIDKEISDVRVVKCVPLRTDYGGNTYYLGPKILEKKEDINIPQGTTTQFWITLKVPEDAKPGEYQSAVSIQSHKAEPYSIALKLRVLPFRLRDEGCYRGMFYIGFYSGCPESMSEMFFKDMKEHGMNSIAIAASFITMKKKGQQPEIDFSGIDREIDRYKKTGFTAPLVWAPGSASIGLTGLVAGTWGVDLESIKIKQADDYPEVLKKPFKRSLKMIYEHAEKNNWPEMYVYLHDEPSGSARLARALAEYKLAREAGREVKTFCTAYGDGVKAFGDTLDVWCDDLNNLLLNQKANKEAIAFARETNKNLWSVSWPAMYDDFWTARKEAGLSTVKTGVSGSMWWVYYSPGNLDDDYFDLRDPKFKSTRFTYIPFGKSANEITMPTPTLSWEGMREGIDDARYIHTLRYYIAIARKSGIKKAIQEADKAEQNLHDILKQIPWLDDPKEKKDNFNNIRANEIRWTIIERIFDLQDVLKVQLN